METRQGAYWCGCLARDGSECGAVVEGGGAERREHLEREHPGLYGGLFLAVESQSPSEAL